MKTFQTIQEKMTSWNLFSNRTPFLNPNFQRTFVTAVLSISSNIVFLFYVSNTVEQYMITIYMTTAAISILTSYVNISHSVSTLEKFFEKTNETFEESK